MEKAKAFHITLSVIFA